jgi:predicted dehydrogenase
MHLTPEERVVGKDNFHAVIGSDLTRREFLLGSVAAAAAGGIGLGAHYFAYSRVTDPVRIGVIGTGDEGSVLIGAHTPEYTRIVAIADIRPYNIHRAFHGDLEALGPRPGLMAKYGWTSEDQARAQVKVYDKDYHELLNDPDVEGVVIALPLHLHAKVAIEALRAGKHVLTEKLMGHSVHQCKEMGRVSEETKKLLATGHQRHYSILYDNAVDTIRRGLIGPLHHIRAQWHRNNLPGSDSWQQPLPNDDMRKALAELEKKLDEAVEKKDRKRMDDLSKQVAATKVRLLDAVLDDAFAASHGYEEKKLMDASGATAYVCSPLEELIRWRLWNRTGGGLMAELGSHQLDASSIFIAAEYERQLGIKTKVQPLSVSAVGGRHTFPLDRDADDHVYCSYEFPGPLYYSDYEKKVIGDPNKKIVVTYSSINGNGFGGYGEVVMGEQATLILEREQEVMLFPNKGGTLTSVGVTRAKGSDAPALSTQESGGGPAAAVGKSALEGGPVSRGYTEEIEHWAWCIRNPGDPDKPNLPRCHPKVALGDAVIALTSNIAMRDQRRIEFKPEWFDIHSDETPEDVKPDLAKYA